MHGWVDGFMADTYMDTLTKSTENGEPKQQPTAHDCLTQVVFSTQWTNTSEGKQNKKHFVVVVVESHVVHVRFP